MSGLALLSIIMPLVTCYSSRIFPLHGHYSDVKYSLIKYIVNPTLKRGLQMGSNGSRTRHGPRHWATWSSPVCGTLLRWVFDPFQGFNGRPLCFNAFGGLWTNTPTWIMDDVPFASFACDRTCPIDVEGN